MKIECDRCGRCFPEDLNHVGYPAVHHCIQDAPSYEELVAALVAMVYEDCSGTIGRDTRSRMDMLATTDAEEIAVRLLERLGKVKNVRQIGGSVRADWVKEEAENEG